jgi:uncharacterized membrane protein YfcA
MFAYILLGVFILFAYTAEAVTGFGSIVIALSLGALLFPIEWLQTVLVPLNICMTGFLAWRHRAHIDWALLSRLILPFMLVGTLSGYALQARLGGAGLKITFAVLILWFALRELRRMHVGLAAPARPTWLSRVIVTAAGITHGLFASGGPLLVYGLAGMTLDKARFRATLILVWFSLNSVLTVLFLAQGRLQEAWLPILSYLPLIPLGIWLGERLHHRIDEIGFRRWIYSLLVLAGLGLLSGTLLRMI